MVDWQITAKTIYCESIDDEATLIASKSGVIKCTSQTRYIKPDRELAKTLSAKQKRLGRKLGCEAKECAKASRYREELFSEKKSK